MSDSPNIEGLPQPQRVGEPKTEADTEKFKRMMKVDESDETQKRQKRHRPKQEEEEEEEKVEDQRSPHIDFGQYLAKAKKAEGIFDVQEGIEPQLIPAEESAPVKLTTPITAPPLKTEEERKEKEEKEQKRAKQIEKEQAAAATQAKKEKEEVKRIDLPALAPAPAPTPALAPTHTPTEEAATEEATLPIPAPPTPTPTVPLFEETERAEAKAEVGAGEEAPIVIPPKKHEPKKKEPEAAQATPPPTEAILLSPVTPLERIAPPSYASLSPAVFELFERLVGLMTIQQTKGISTTTVTLNMPGSVFNGCQIVLEHYNTAPHSFNLELLGTPEAIQIFQDNLSDLAASFQGSKLAFTVNLRTPALLEEHRPLIRRKEKPGEKKPDE